MDLNFINISISILAFLIASFFVYSAYIQSKFSLKLSKNATNYTENMLISKIKYICFGVGFILLLIGNINPSIDFFNSNVVKSGFEVMFVVDSSSSMDTADILSGQEKISRLDFTKQIIKNFISSNNGNEYGLMTFAGKALMISPLTVETDILLTFLNNLNTSAIKEGGTNIEEALGTASYTLQENKSKMIVLFSDGGEKEDSINFEKLKKIIGNKPIKIFTVGIGSTSGDRIPIGTDFFGNINYKKWGTTDVISKLYEDNLKKIAELGNGKYIKATSIDALENLKKDFTKSNSINFLEKDSGRYFVIIAFLFFIIGVLLPNKKLLNYTS